MMRTGAVKAILFDMDGVLVDSEPVIRAAAMAGLLEYGVSARSEDFDPFVGAGEDRFIGGVAEKYGVPYRIEMKDRVYRIYLELVDRELRVYEGVNGLLASLRRTGYVLALASSADRIKVEANLRTASIPTAVFSAVVTGEDVANKKPAPDIYLAAARKIGEEPARCVVIEDALNGIASAKAAGMRCIAVATSFPEEKLEREHPDFICSRTVDILPVLERLG